MAAGAAVTQSEDSGHDKPNAQIQLEKPVDTSPLYTMQAFFDGKMKVEDFARSEQERPSVPHYVFDDTLPVIDIAAIKERSSEEREANVAKMLMAARSWGFFRIINHDVPVELVLNNALEPSSSSKTMIVKRPRGLSDVLEVS